VGGRGKKWSKHYMHIRINKKKYIKHMRNKQTTPPKNIAKLYAKEPSSSFFAGEYLGDMFRQINMDG
jgi:intein-encoded DNA endonuclease-like protein